MKYANIQGVRYPADYTPAKVDSKRPRRKTSKIPASVRAALLAKSLIVQRRSQNTPAPSKEYTP